MNENFEFDTTTLEETLGIDAIPALLDDDWNTLWGVEPEPEEELSF